MSTDSKIISFDDAFIDAILEKKNQINLAIDSNKYKKVNSKYRKAISKYRSDPPPAFFEDDLKIFVNLFDENKSIFNKRSRKLIPFKDKRIKNLITLLADDIFWKEVYLKSISYCDDVYQQSDLPAIKFSSNYLFGKSIISRLIYFLMGKNPYGKDLFGKHIRFFADEVEYSSQAKMLKKVTDRLNFEVQSFIHYCEGVLSVLNNLKPYILNFEVKEHIKAFEFLLSSIADAAKPIEVLKKLWLKNDNFNDADLILLWGGTKRAYFNDTENRPKRMSELDYGYKYDEAFNWLKLKNALGKDGFNFEKRENDINYPKDLDELSTIFATTNKQFVPVDEKLVDEIEQQILDKQNNIFQSIEAVKEKYPQNELSNSEKEELKKKLLDYLNEIS